MEKSFCAAGVVRLILFCALTAPSSLPAQEASANAAPAADVPVLEIGDNRTTGSAKANIAVVEFGDFECSHCGEFFSGPYQKLKDRYVSTGKVRFAWRHLPLPMHPHAVDAAKATQCAARQDKFWPMHDMLLTHQQNLTTADLKQYASSMGLDAARFEECMQSSEAAQQVESDLEKARELGVRATPTLLIGTIGPDGRMKVQERISGGAPIEEIQKAIDSLSK